MLIGRFYHALEQKGRVSIPPSLRTGLGQDAVITRGLDGCLFVFPKVIWEAVVEEAQNMPLTKKQARDWIRLLANNASPATLDNLGRILIPEYLRETAHLRKALVVVGSLTHIEIWDQDAYHTYLRTLESQAEAITEGLAGPSAAPVFPITGPKRK
jgi:MraZ protein